MRGIFACLLLVVLLNGTVGLGAAPSLRSDERVLLYPALARATADGWSLDVHGLVYEPERQRRNTFVRPFKPVPGLAGVYAAWSRAGVQFHYVTASPWQLYPALSEFVRSNGFPQGTFHMKNFRVKDGTFLDLFQSPEEYKTPLITALFDQFPQRRFVLVGDSGEKDPEIYAGLARRYRERVKRIFIRDVTGQGSDDARYRETFGGLPADLWRIFTSPTELEAVGVDGDPTEK